MRPFIIDDSIRGALQKLVDYAEANPISMDYLLDQHNGEEPPPGDDPNRYIDLPFGYRVVFTIELQPVGKVRHLSLSVDSPGRVPNTPVVEEVMKMLGFEKELHDCKISFEEFGPKRTAINVYEIAG